MSTTAVHPLASHATRTRAGWWLGAVRRWHLLSLDAPLVAAVWLLLFTGGEPVMARATQAAALAIAVWLLYAGDRVLDAARAGGEPLQARHYFHAAHRRRFAAVAVCGVCWLAWLVAELPRATRLGWLWLGVPMATYALAIHRWRVRRLPKEMIVAVMFAAATTLPALVQHTEPWRRTVIAGGLFAVVCWLNCVAIARWEAESVPTGVHRFWHGARSTAWGARHLGSLCLGTAMASVGCAALCGAPALCAGGSALLLLLLHCRRHRVEAVALRALSDAALLTPVLWGAVQLCWRLR